MMLETQGIVIQTTPNHSVVFCKHVGTKKLFYSNKKIARYNKGSIVDLTTLELKILSSKLNSCYIGGSIRKLEAIQTLIKLCATNLPPNYWCQESWCVLTKSIELSNIQLFSEDLFFITSISAFINNLGVTKEPLIKDLGRLFLTIANASTAKRAAFLSRLNLLDKKIIQKSIFKIKRLTVDFTQGML